MGGVFLLLGGRSGDFQDLSHGPLFGLCGHGPSGRVISVLICYTEAEGLVEDNLAPSWFQSVYVTLMGFVILLEVVPAPFVVSPRNSNLPLETSRYLNGLWCKTAWVGILVLSLPTGISFEFWPLSASVSSSGLSGIVPQLLSRVSWDLQETVYPEQGL